jgi:hypothetical protein
MTLVILSTNFAELLAIRGDAFGFTVCTLGYISL